MIKNIGECLLFLVIIGILIYLQKRYFNKNIFLLVTILLLIFVIYTVANIIRKKSKNVEIEPESYLIDNVQMLGSTIENFSNNDSNLIKNSSFEDGTKTDPEANSVPSMDDIDSMEETEENENTLENENNKIVRNTYIPGDALYALRQTSVNSRTGEVYYNIPLNLEKNTKYKFSALVGYTQNWDGCDNVFYIEMATLNNDKHLVAHAGVTKNVIASADGDVVWKQRELMVNVSDNIDTNKEINWSIGKGGSRNTRGYRYITNVSVIKQESDKRIPEGAQVYLTTRDNRSYNKNSKIWRDISGNGRHFKWNTLPKNKHDNDSSKLPVLITNKTNYVVGPASNKLGIENSESAEFSILWYGNFANKVNDGVIFMAYGEHHHPNPKHNNIGIRISIIKNQLVIDVGGCCEVHKHRAFVILNNLINTDIFYCITRDKNNVIKIYENCTSNICEVQNTNNLNYNVYRGYNLSNSEISEIEPVTFVRNEAGVEQCINLLAENENSAKYAVYNENNEGKCVLYKDGLPTGHSHASSQSSLNSSSMVESFVPSQEIDATLELRVGNKNANQQLNREKENLNKCQKYVIGRNDGNTEFKLASDCISRDISENPLQSHCVRGNNHLPPPDTGSNTKFKLSNKPCIINPQVNCEGGGLNLNITDFMIYNRVLSKEEMASIHDVIRGNNGNGNGNGNGDSDICYSNSYSKVQCYNDNATNLANVDSCPTIMFTNPSYNKYCYTMNNPNTSKNESKCYTPEENYPSPAYRAIFEYVNSSGNDICICKKEIFDFVNKYIGCDVLDNIDRLAKDNKKKGIRVSDMDKFIDLNKKLYRIKKCSPSDFVVEEEKPKKCKCKKGCKKN